jgi:hypothetical protein
MKPEDIQPVLDRIERCINREYARHQDTMDYDAGDYDTGYLDGLEWVLSQLPGHDLIEPEDDEDLSLLNVDDYDL